jgi:hypothetical protein
MRNAGIVHPWFRPLTRRDIGLSAAAGLLLVLAVLALAFGGDFGLIAGSLMSITGIVVFVCALMSRTWRQRNQV